MNIIKNSMWALARPHYGIEFARKVVYRLRLGKELESSAAVRGELGAIARSDHDVLLQLYGHETKLLSFSDECVDEIIAAQGRIAKVSDSLGGAAALDLLFNAVLLAKPKRVLETGVAYGWSSLAILKAMQANGGGALASIDFPQFGTTGSAVGLAVPESLRDNWLLFVGPDRTELRKAIDKLGGIDLCHYDSDKSIAGRKFAYPILWEALSEGGLFLSDDIGDNCEFLEFARRVAREPTVIFVDEVGGNRKFIGQLIK